MSKNKVINVKESKSLNIAYWYYGNWTDIIPS